MTEATYQQQLQQPIPSTEDLPNPEIQSECAALQADSLSIELSGKPHDDLEGWDCWCEEAQEGRDIAIHVVMTNLSCCMAKIEHNIVK